MIYNHIKKIVEGVSALLFPRYLRCIACDRDLQDKNKYSLCDECAKKIVLVNEAESCRICGRGLYSGGMLCDECKEQKPYFRKSYSVVIYNDCAKQLVHRLKYMDKRYISFYTAKMMADKLKRHSLSYDYILYVPMHIKKEIERGYNQARLLAKYISEETSIPVNSSLIRVKHTQDMNKLSKKLRAINLVNAFDLDLEDRLVLKDKNVLLVDDVYTTGATANECARVLLDYGVCHVDVITFATGISHR